MNKGQLLWLAYNLPAVSALRDSTVVFIDYDRLMDSPVREMERVAETLGLDLENAEEKLSGYAKEFLYPGLRHFRLTAEDLRTHPDVFDPVRQSYEWLHQLATDETTLRDPSLLSSWLALERSWRSSSKLAECIDEVEASLVELREAHREALDDARSMEGERVRLEKRGLELVVERDESTAAHTALERERAKLERYASQLLHERDEAVAEARALNTERDKLESYVARLTQERVELEKERTRREVENG